MHYAKASDAHWLDAFDLKQDWPMELVQGGKMESLV